MLKLGIGIKQTSVAEYMLRQRRSPSQGWKTFLRNHSDSIAAMDLFVVLGERHLRHVLCCYMDYYNPASQHPSVYVD